MCILFPLLAPHMPQCVNCAGMLTTCPAHLMVLTSTLYTSLPPTPICILPPIPLLSSRVLCTGHAGAIISGGKGGANDKVLCRETPQISTKG